MGGFCKIVNPLRTLFGHQRVEKMNPEVEIAAKKEYLRTLEKKRALQEEIDEVKLEISRLKKMWKGMKGKIGKIEAVCNLKRK